MMKKLLTVILSAVLVVMIACVAFGVVTSAADSTIAYSFAKADKGFAQGTITVTAGPSSGGTYYLYWADDKAALQGYDPIGVISVPNSGSAYVTMPEYTAIPATATKILGYKASSAPSNLSASAASTVYTLPSDKILGKSSDDLLYSFASYSDFHISSNEEGSSQSYPYDEQHLLSSFNTAAARDVDFIVTTGDHVNNQRADNKGGSNPFYPEEWNTYLKILSQSNYANPIYEAIGNHELWCYDTESNYSNKDWKTGYNYFIQTTGLDSTAAAAKSGKAYYEITEPVTGDHFLFMALEGGFYTDRVNEFSDAQLTWLENKLKQYQNDGKNTFVLEHANFFKWGAGDLLDDPVYDIPLKDSNSATAKLKAILQKYKDAVMVSGHTHFKLLRQLNYSNNNGTSMTMIHNSSVGAVRDIKASMSGPSARINDKSADQTEGYIVEVYDNATIFYGINVHYNQIIPVCSYIVPGHTSAINPVVKPTEAPTAAPTPAPTQAPTPAPTQAPLPTHPLPTPTEPVPTEKPTQPAEPIRYGDVDGSGDVEVFDVTAIQRHLADMEFLSEEALVRARVNGDEDLTIFDATTIQRYLADMISVFPVQEAQNVAAASKAMIADTGADIELSEAAADLNTLRTQAADALSKYWQLASYDQYQALKKAYKENAGYDVLNAAYTDMNTAVKTFYTGDTVDIYFSNNVGWSNVYAYCSAGHGKDKNASWPGQKMTYVTTNTYGEKIYKLTVPTAKYNFIIFTNNAGQQTVDLPLGITKNQGFYYDSKLGQDSRGYLRCSSYTYQ